MCVYIYSKANTLDVYDPVCQYPYGRLLFFFPVLISLYCIVRRVFSAIDWGIHGVNIYTYLE